MAGQVFGPFAAKVVDVHDGDTVFVDILIVASKAHRAAQDVDLGFNIHKVSGVGVVLERAVRLLGINAPELATPAGKAALAFILSVCPVGTMVELLSHGWDKYGGRIDGAQCRGTVLV